MAAGVVATCLGGCGRTPAGGHATAQFTSAVSPAAAGGPALSRHSGLADDVASMPPTQIIQFPLVPSGLKPKFSQATGVVTIVVGLVPGVMSDTVTVTVQHMPAHTTFTMFLSELAVPPFGNVEYVADLVTRGDGTGETTFNSIATVAFAMNSDNAGTTTGKEGPTSGVNLEHFGMWFASIDAARSVLGDKSLKPTIFDGGSPAAHAGPQAMTDGQGEPVL